MCPSSKKKKWNWSLPSTSETQNPGDFEVVLRDPSSNKREEAVTVNEDTSEDDHEDNNGNDVDDDNNDQGDND